jgi:hypothetical protein
LLLLFAILIDAEIVFPMDIYFLPAGLPYASKNSIGMGGSHVSIEVRSVWVGSECLIFEEIQLWQSGLIT